MNLYGVESGVESFKGYLTMYYILIPDKNSVENFKCCYFLACGLSVNNGSDRILPNRTSFFINILNESYVPVLEYLRPI